jgi:Dolichyl-phosphate-mannose-protein mannosyltransferase
LPGASVERSASGSLWRYVLGAILGAGLAYGIFIRLWFLFHLTISSDEANAGMLAEQILHGHFHAFYPGQVYGGAEFYALAVVVGIGGHNSFSLHLEPILFSVAAAVLIWRVSLRLVRSRPIAALAGVFVLAAPEVNIATSSIYQGRGLPLCCGLICVLIGLRLLDEADSLQNRKGLLDLGAFGLAAGLGWWSMPEITYFYPAAGLLLLGAFVVRREGAWIRARLARLGLVVLTFVVGALPWIWDNVMTHFASLNTASLEGGTQGTLWVQLSTHFHPFILYVLPMELGLREQQSGAWFGDEVISYVVAVLVFALLALSLITCLWKPGRSRAIAISALFFPILYSINPGTWFWQDGRYAVYLAPLLVLTIAIGVDEVSFRLHDRVPSRGLHLGEAAMTVIVLGSLVLSAIAFGDATGVSVSTIGRGWGSPDAKTLSAIKTIEAAGVTDGYADYWVAYKLDYLSDGGLVIDTSGIGADLDRWPNIDAIVTAAPKAAWLFVPPDGTITAESAFTVLGGPNGEAESDFIAGLKQAHIRYRVVDAGVLQAVIAQQKVPPRLEQGPLVIGG